jgi:hypothetical protein
VTLCGAYYLIYIFKCIKIIVIEIINGEDLDSIKGDGDFELKPI